MYYLGIDFGAQNIMVQYLGDQSGIGDLVKFDDGNDEYDYCPNAYAIDDNGTEYFGWRAVDALSRNEIKRERFFDHYKSHLIEQVDNGVNRYTKEITPQVLFYKLLQYTLKVSFQYIKDHVNDNAEIRRVVITLPASWENAILRDMYASTFYKVCQELKIAAELKIIEEPTAAVIRLIKQIQSKDAFNCAVLDIGASTTDVSICRYNPTNEQGEVIKIVAKANNNKAGRHFDELVAQQISDERSHEALKKAEQLKQSDPEGTARRRNFFIGEIWKAFREKLTRQKVEKLASEFADDCADLIRKTLATHEENINVDYLMVCGGMSSLEFGFKDSLVDAVSRILPGCKIPGFNHQETTDNTLKRRAICYGAASLAKDPGLIKERLGFDLLLEVVQGGEQQLDYLEIFPADLEINDSEHEVSVLDLVERNNWPCIYVDTGAEGQLSPALKLASRSKGSDVMHRIALSFDRPIIQTAGIFEGTQIIDIAPEDTSYDLSIKLLSDGALRVEIISFRDGTVLSSGVLQSMRESFRSPNRIRIGR